MVATDPLPLLTNTESSPFLLAVALRVGNYLKIPFLMKNVHGPLFRPKTTPPMIKTDTFCDIVPFPGHGADAATFSHLLEGNLCLLHVIVDHVQPLLDPVQLLCTRGG